RSTGRMGRRATRVTGLPGRAAVGVRPADRGALVTPLTTPRGIRYTPDRARSALSRYDPTTHLPRRADATRVALRSSWDHRVASLGVLVSQCSTACRVLCGPFDSPPRWRRWCVPRVR